MHATLRGLSAVALTMAFGWSGATAQVAPPSGTADPVIHPVDWQMVARIREEGLQRSQLASTLSYMTDVLGARLTNSRDMKRAQRWVVDEMGKALIPGKTFSEMHGYASDLYSKMGIDPMYLHVGHSVGLQVEEHWIMSDDPTKVESGMVLNIELYSFSEEGVMIGDEETFLVTDAGPEKLSILPADIIERKF